ncbi:DUF3130 family protein [Listeria booriae]|uniref:DUF3130 family protein n=1 Tax=Listeria booriae TaxID=1552123 RepID=UPI0016243D99|nr:DUF3130 family protein [Listeria booriae]MBC2149781.1 DUF3130 family protein [Listeria booriae]
MSEEIKISTESTNQYAHKLNNHQELMTFKAVSDSVGSYTNLSSVSNMKLALGKIDTVVDDLKIAIRKDATSLKTAGEEFKKKDELVADMLNQIGLAPLQPTQSQASSKNPYIDSLTNPFPF